MGLSLEVEGLTVHAGGREVLHDFGLRVTPGEFVAVVGPNGAGKSSLLRAVTGEWKSRGRVELFGSSLHGWRRRDLAKRVAVMPQTSALAFDFTVHEVVGLGRLPHRERDPAANREAVSGALECLHLSPLADRRYLTLSGGERQRVQFARVLAQIWRPAEQALLLLDEPTSALDLAQQRSVLDIAHAQAEAGTAVVAVLHDLNLAARYATRVVMVGEGRIALDASCGEAITRANIARVFGVDVFVEMAACDGRPVVVNARSNSGTGTPGRWRTDPDAMIPRP